MWAYIRAALLLTIYSVEAKRANTGKPLLYWKDFTGLPVPKDAIFSGVQTAAAGKPRDMFLAQVSLLSVENSGLQPTALYNDSTSVDATYNHKVYSTNKYIKVLCSNMPPEKNSKLVTWMPSQRLNTETKSHLVIAGHEKKGETYHNVFFGRGYDGYLFVTGKVLIDYSTQTYRLYYPWKNGERYIEENIEILVYTKHLL